MRFLLDYPTLWPDGAIVWRKREFLTAADAMGYALSHKLTEWTLYRTDKTGTDVCIGTSVLGCF